MFEKSQKNCSENEPCIINIATRKRFKWERNDQNNTVTVLQRVFTDTVNFKLPTSPKFKKVGEGTAKNYHQLTKSIGCYMDVIIEDTNPIECYSIFARHSAKKFIEKKKNVKTKRVF